MGKKSWGYAEKRKAKDRMKGHMWKLMRKKGKMLLEVTGLAKDRKVFWIWLLQSNAWQGNKLIEEEEEEEDKLYRACSVYIYKVQTIWNVN